MIETSHHGAFPIHRFWPLRTHVSPSRFAVVSSPPRRARTHQRLGQAEAADLLHAGHRRQPLLLLLLRPAEVDRTHRQAVVDAEEGRDRGIDPRHLHRDQAEQLHASAAAPVSLHPQSTEIQLFDRREQFEWE